MPKSKSSKKPSSPRNVPAKPSSSSSSSASSSAAPVPLRMAPAASGHDHAHAQESAPPLSSGGGMSLLRLERPFDIDEFCQQLGETKISAVVPREQLSEVLKRVVEFMEFGIYVYAVVVIPGPSATLEKFTVSLDRIDFDPKRKGWTPFQEKGRSDSPFGPGGKGPTSRDAPH